MRILLSDNVSFDMDKIPDRMGDDLFYCVLDYSNQQDVDFFFVPMVITEQFPRPAADLKIGPHRIQMPLDWSIMITDRNLGTLEMVELKQINDRQFDAFAMNPIDGYFPEFHEITIQNVFADVTWNIPRLKRGHILVVPLSEKPNSPCVFFVREGNRLPDGLDISKVF